MSSTAPSRGGAPQPPPGAVAAWRAMLEVHRDVMESLATDFRTCHQLSISDFDVLINIGPYEDVRHRDLAERVVLSRSALSRLVDRLVVRGFLTRRKVENDSRGVLIALTPAGRMLRDEAAHSNDTIVEEAFAVLDMDEVAALQRLAMKLTHYNEVRTVPPSPGERLEEMS